MPTNQCGNAQSNTTKTKDYKMYQFIHEHHARQFVYIKRQNGVDTILTKCDGYWWVEEL